MISYSDYNKKTITQTLNLGEWDLISRLLRQEQRRLRAEKEYLKLPTLTALTDKIDKKLKEVIDGGNN